MTLANIIKNQKEVKPGYWTDVKKGRRRNPPKKIRRVNMDQSVCERQGTQVKVEFEDVYGEELAQSKSLIDTVIVPDSFMEAINMAISQVRPEIREKIFEEWGFKHIFEKGYGVTILFYGPPGTGKTLMAQAIAEKTGRDLKIVGSAEIESSEPGGAERAIKQYFQEAQKNEWTLLFDECDSLIYDRSRIGMILGAQVNCLLGELEKFDGICIFTTNNTPVLDKALERRLMLKLCFPRPDRLLRKRIWFRMIPRKSILGKDVNLEELSEVDLSGGQIKNIVLNSARRAAFLKKGNIGLEDILICMEQELEGSKAFQFDGGDGVVSQEALLGDMSTERENSGNEIRKTPSILRTLRKRVEKKINSMVGKK